MSFPILQAARFSERIDDLHLARLLLLVSNVGGGKSAGIVDGITKLAKLDFLLRYPVYFERVLGLIGKPTTELPGETYEWDNVECKMIRFRYGPWDPRYRRWIGLLVAKGLAETFLRGRTVMVCLTANGKKIAEQLSARDEFTLLGQRSVMVAKQLGKLSGTRLKNIVYEAIPEISGMSWGDVIQP